MSKCVDDLSNGQAVLYKCTSEGTTLNPTDSLQIRQLITLGIASYLGLGDCRTPTGLGLMSTPSQYAAVCISSSHNILGRCIAAKIDPNEDIKV